MFRYNDETRMINECWEFMWYWHELGYDLNTMFVEVKF